MGDFKRIDCLVTLYKKAKKKALIFGLRDLADDFASHYILNILDGKSAHQLFKHSIIDFMRMEFNSVNKVKVAAREWIYLAGSEFYSLDEKIALLNVLNKIATNEEKQMLHLYFIDGYELNKIGKMYGKSESRISQIFATIAKKAKKPFWNY